ncbi:nucleoside hydrolase [Nocardia sp. NBC_00565]|uniref:nucleoside hydrolase n=1 Tax=Nocardia sp. NBC_00565 TaxID=2975993 RepID=UPI002E820514|nr:nucleoside hydrolase [Nocardia sp. NBC_00565]WUC02025.1 nucleoside hydrolase [Nocardia sp. NBC_00565]
MFDNPQHPDEQPPKDLARLGTSPLNGLVILDTDIAYDPDDFVALAIAARTLPDLAVITADETRGRRAQLARRALDSMGRHDVAVIAGIDLGGEHRFLMDGYLDQPPSQPDDTPGHADDLTNAVDGLVDAVTRLCTTTTGPIFWIGMGPMTNLAVVLSSVPDLAERMVVTQMGGWLDCYRDKTRASHNFHTDPVSAGLALRLIRMPRLVLSDFTNSSTIEVTNDSAMLRRLRSSTAPEWARLLAANFDAWFLRRSGSWMHDPLTLSAALGLPFVTFRPERIRIERDARIYRDPDGRAMQVTCNVDYARFLEWMHAGVSA